MRSMSFIVEEHYWNRCRVCGLVFTDEFPWGDDGRCPTSEFCVCCGNEFGDADITPQSAANAREQWIAEGMPWFNPDRRPEDWDANAQLAQVPPLSAYIEVGD